jgi:hypothetical protein
MAAKADWTLDPNTRANVCTVSLKSLELYILNEGCSSCPQSPRKTAPATTNAATAALLHHNGYASTTPTLPHLIPQTPLSQSQSLASPIDISQASPKFSTFICLQCAGVHRGLGVHVSFVRSVSMDQWKKAEIARMEHGGNKAWQDFFTANSGKQFSDVTIKERYESEVGEEWKERLSCLVEGRQFDKVAFGKEREEVRRKIASRAATPVGQTRSKPISSATVTGSGPTSRTASPAPSRGAPLDPTQKSQNEAYFARMGETNASRPDDLPPSQGGKYGGFGSAMPETAASTNGGGLPSTDEFQKDPVAALTKGFGWFGGMVSKQAKMVNESYIQPTAKNVSPQLTPVLIVCLRAVADLCV